MKIVFLGAPGTGKGTCAERLAPRQNLPHISTGELLRHHIQERTELGEKAKGYMNKGLLVPDELILEILKHRLQEKDCETGFILDGFPRNLEQAEQLQTRVLIRRP